MLLCSAIPSLAGINLSSPSGTSASSPVRFVVSASPTSSKYSISGFQIDVDGVKKFYTKSSNIDTSISIGSGSHSVIIKAWDTSGAIQKLSRTLSISGTTQTSGSTGSSSTSTGDTDSWYDIEEMDGWQQCDRCAGVAGAGPTAIYWMKKNVSSPSQDGNSTQFFLGGSNPYANVLFSKRLTGDSSFIRKKRKFIYDAYFYYTNAEAAQALEFDINQHIDGKSYIWGTQCNIRAGHSWDIWDNVNKRWIDSGAYCPTPDTYKWNHVVLEMERTSDNKLRYIAITFNGTKHYLNRYYSPRSNTWVGLTLNYQMDGNVRQEDYSTWVDNFKFVAW